jgi:NAD(P)-dependent dehydrogenase (short-subunit alcohol dehydrogenase family)
VPTDISKKEDIHRLVNRVADMEVGGIQLLVNNAGIARDDNTKYSNGKPDFKVLYHWELWNSADDTCSLRNPSQII